MNSILSNYELFRQAAENSVSIGKMIESLGLTKSGSMYKTVRKYSEIHGIPLPDGTHAGLGGRKIPNEEIFIENSTYLWRDQIKKRLVEDFGRKYMCSMDDCQNPTPFWRGAPLSLHLDHINGINDDNRIENLRFLCPNCHSQTETYCGKQKAARLRDPELFICSCGAAKMKNSNRCKKCSNKINGVERRGNTAIDWPPIEILIQELKTKSYTDLAKELGCSDNAIRKHIKRNGAVVPKKYGTH